jgi:RNA-directed DNA polymerase
VAPADRIQVVVKVQRYVAEGKCWVVALDLEKFFDRVNHEKLMAAVTRWVADKRVLSYAGISHRG